MTHLNRISQFAMLMLAAGFGTGPAAADDFYRGKDVRMLISHPPGGGYDTYARLFARYLPNHLAGRPNVLSQNQPGAAGLVMANGMAGAQPKDGTVIGLGPGSVATADILGSQGVRYDAQKFSWIGSMNADVGVALAWETSPIKTAEDLLSKELIVGASGSTDQSVLFPVALNRVLKTKFKVVSGYEGSAAQGLALERGEVSGIGGMNYSTILANKPEWLKSKKVNILIQLALARHPDLPTVPTAIELAKTPEQRAVLELIFASSSIGRVIFAPPGVPAERLAELRAAFDAVMADKEFLAEAERLKVEINQPMPGKAVAALVEKLHQVSPDVAQQARAAVETQ
jgi:tripartite-type tricarboxylate transporter receptor subunit TctC